MPDRNADRTALADRWLIAVVSQRYCRAFDLMPQMSNPPSLPERGNQVRESASRPAITVAPIALGCGNFGGIGSAPEFFGQGLTDDQALELMDAAWNSGIRHFDTADAYGGGRSERVIGRWILTRGVRPQLTTKTFNPVQSGADHGLKPERIARQLRASLDRLGVDRVDLYLAHDFDPDVPLGDSFGAFEQARADGAIDAYGVSNFDARQLADSLAAGAPQAIQNSYSLLAREDERELLPLCAQRGIAYLAFSPLAGGWLTGKYRPGEPFPASSRMAQRPEPYRDLVATNTFDFLARLQLIAADRGTTMAALALAWLLADERVAQVVVGPGSAAQLAPVAEAVKHPLSADERIAIEGAYSR
jgi:aryl-alcohol dehydrogenase-like predicted oxidoreductase